MANPPINLDDLARDISQARGKIKDDFCKAYLACNWPDGMDLGQFINSLVLVESREPTRVTWHFEVNKTRSKEAGND